MKSNSVVVAVVELASNLKAMTLACDYHTATAMLEKATWPHGLSLFNLVNSFHNKKKTTKAY